VVVFRLREVVRRWLWSEGGWSCLQGSGCGEAGWEGCRHQGYEGGGGCDSGALGAARQLSRWGGDRGCRALGAAKQVSRRRSWLRGAGCCKAGGQVGGHGRRSGCRWGSGVVVMVARCWVL
jgi:hypothetical protein